MFSDICGVLRIVVVGGDAHGFCLAGFVLFGEWFKRRFLGRESRETELFCVKWSENEQDKGICRQRLTFIILAGRKRKRQGVTEVVFENEVPSYMSCLKESHVRHLS